MLRDEPVNFEPGDPVVAPRRGVDVECRVVRVVGVHVECEDSARKLWWWTTKDQVSPVAETSE
jgi:hypothetical protein